MFHKIDMETWERKEYYHYYINFIKSKYNLNVDMDITKLLKLVKEKKLSDYLVKFANDLGLEVKQDNLYNVIIYKPASKGYENHPAIILQSHIDMVCEKNGDCNFDFEKDSLQLYIEDGFVRAKGTTLGADDGAGAALTLSLIHI